MTIAELIMPLDVVFQEGNLDMEVAHITNDSRLVKAGSFFIAVRGIQVDGHAFIEKVWEQGAVGIMVQAPFQDKEQGFIEEKSYRTPCVIQVSDTRKALGILAARFWGNPSLKLHMVGVTGTNGKTTVTHLTKALFQASGQKVGLIGTLGYSFGVGHTSGTHTTPDSVSLQTFLAKMIESGLHTAVLEVSSHALALDRVAGCEFDTVVFTNLTPDHLDFHGDMQEYFKAKSKLFKELIVVKEKQIPKRAIVNIDDEWGRLIAEECSAAVWTYSIHESSDIQARDICLSIDGIQFTAVIPTGSFFIHSPLVGKHNVYNVLAAIGVGLAAGLSVETIQQTIATFHAVPGRFELINMGQSFRVVVDYAHTEDALAHLLATARTLRCGRILTVFGCGGNRDRAKRPKMGGVAARNSNVVYVTSDNPRTEDPLEIINEIEAGILAVPEKDRADYRVIPDRQEAIHAAIHEANKEDMVLIAGKGHEDYQIIGTQRIRFDDREEAKTILTQIVEVSKD